MRALSAALALACLACLIASAFFYTRAVERNLSLRQLLRTALEPSPGPAREDTVLALARAIYGRTNDVIDPGSLDWYERLESRSFFNVSTAVSLRHRGHSVPGGISLGPCGTMSRVLVNALWELGIPARKLYLFGAPGAPIQRHVLVEFRDGDRWAVVSPSDSAFAWREPGGRIATAREIANDSLVFAQVFETHRGYPITFERRARIRWDKLPAPIVSAFRRVLGPEAFRRAQTPRLYDRPRLLFLWISLGLATASAAGLVACLRGLARNRSRRHWPPGRRGPGRVRVPYAIP